MGFYEHTIGEEGNGKPPHKPTPLIKNSEPCLWFLLRSKSNILWDSMNILLVRKATVNHLTRRTPLTKNSEPCLWFLLRFKSSMRRSGALLFPTFVPCQRFGCDKGKRQKAARYSKRLNRSPPSPAPFHLPFSPLLKVPSSVGTEE